MPEVFVGNTSDFLEGKMKNVDVNGKKILMVNIKGKLYAINDVCTHEECSLSDGELEGNLVVCSCHFAKFDLRNGKNVEKPITGNDVDDEPSYKIQIKGNDVFISV